MPTARACAAVTTLHGHLYVMGGRSSSKNNIAPATLDVVEVYDPETDTWMELGPMPVGRCEATLAVIWFAPATLDVVEVYVLETDLWIELGPMPVGRSEATLAVNLLIDYVSDH